MASNSKQTARIRKRKLSKQGKKRKRLIRRNGSTPSLNKILEREPSGDAS